MADEKDNQFKMSNIFYYVTESNNFINNRKTSRLDSPLKTEYKIINSEQKNDIPIEVFKGAIKDISVNGCLLIINKNISINTEIELDIFFDNEVDKKINVIGKIIRLNREEDEIYEFGIQFNKLSGETRKIFADFCFKKMYERIRLKDWPTNKNT